MYKYLKRNWRKPVNVRLSNCEAFKIKKNSFNFDSYDWEVFSLQALLVRWHCISFGIVQPHPNKNGAILCSSPSNTFLSFYYYSTHVGSIYDSNKNSKLPWLSVLGSPDHNNFYGDVPAQINAKDFPVCNYLA